MEGCLRWCRAASRIKYKHAELCVVQIARQALEPADDPRSGEGPELLARARPLGRGVPQHWAVVRCGCAEGVLATAILAARHADVWDAAALLLREHCGCAYRSRGL